MRQVVVDGRGLVTVQEGARPEPRPNGVVTRTLYSLINTGTESWIVRSRRGAADPQPPEVLGCSNCGRVEEVGPDCGKPAARGDLVAGGGLQMAWHGDYCSIPRNMFAPVPAGVEPEEAAFATLGTDSMHGVRQGRVGLGDRVVVLGTGLIGQMAAQMARLNGGHVMVVGHRNEMRLELARRLGAERVVLNSRENSVDAVLDFTAGLGADVVLMCAAPRGAGTLEQCLEMVRKNGRIVVVGLAELEIPFLQWHRKEAEFLVSRAYGPGRHDPVYEEEGMDYPYNFVRWTLNRNMEEFLLLVAQKKLDVKSLISHTYPVAEAAAAFDLVLDRHEEIVSVLLKYED